MKLMLNLVSGQAIAFTVELTGDADYFAGPHQIVTAVAIYITTDCHAVTTTGLEELARAQPLLQWTGSKRAVLWVRPDDLGDDDGNTVKNTELVAMLTRQQEMHGCRSCRGVTQHKGWCNDNGE